MSKTKLAVQPIDSRLRADVLFLPVVVKKGKIDTRPFKLSGLGSVARTRVNELLKNHHGLGKTGTIDDQIVPAGSPIGRVALLCLGEEQPTCAQDVRHAAGAARVWCNQRHIGRAAILVDALRMAGDPNAAAAIVEGFELAGFRYTPLRSKTSENGSKPLTHLILATTATGSRHLATAARDTHILAETVNLTRFLGHEPPNLINPVTLAARCRSLARQYKLRCRVIDDKQMRAKKMGAILAVGEGSASKPRIIVLEHPGTRRAAPPIVLVGKAVTLDTGGYSIKPAASIPDMKYDKCGGMAVIGALVAAARLKIKQRVVGIIGAAENMISDRAYRPGDIVRAANGKTIEVLNTDAEGRMVLADCLHYAERTYRPAAMIDLATLTGACEIALGGACAAILSNNDKLTNALIDSGEQTGERLWRLPLWEAYREQIAGTDGDIKNTGGRGGGAITAAMFLKEFVDKKTPWAHLDIAGTATVTKATPICPIGATGFGVRLLMDFIRKRK